MNEVWSQREPWEQNGEAPDEFALSLPQFIAADDRDVPPLLGTATNTIIPEAGLVIVAGNPSSGKTTLVVDAIFHLACGREWLGLAVPRPLRVLILENEGPQRKFRQKLAEKRMSWADREQVDRNVFVQTWRWGNFSIAHSDARTRLGSFIDAEGVDMVIGDPLGSLGVEGVGSPKETLEFRQHLVELGLFQDQDGTAFLFPHHFRKEGSPDEINQISGAWGGHLDTLMTLKPTQRRDELRLAFPKLRWARDTIPPLIIGKLRESKGFERLGEENAPELIERQVIALLSDGRVRTTAEIANASKGGIGVPRKRVEEVLEAHPHLFEKGHIQGTKTQAWILRTSETYTPEPPDHAETHGEASETYTPEQEGIF